MKNRSSDALLAAGALILLAVFFAGYRFGIRGETKRGSEQLVPLRKEEQAWIKSLEECQSSQGTYVAKDAKMKVRIDALTKTLDDWKKKSETTYDTVKEADAQFSSCEADLAHQRDIWREEHSAYKDRILQIEAVNAELRMKIKRLASTQGASRHMLQLGLQKSRQENLLWREVLGLEPPAVPHKLDEEVVNRFKGQLDEESLMEARHVTSTENKTLVPHDHKFSYNATKHTELFFPERVNEKGNISRPTYFDRDGTQDVMKGIYVNRRRRRVTSVAGLMTGLYNYALCAYRNGNPNMTYPDRFYPRPDGNLTHASELIDTPLLQFCVDCKRMANTTEFKYACLGDTVKFQYGSRDFWTMRSMLRYHSALYNSAEDYLVQNSLMPEPGDAPKDTPLFRDPLHEEDFIGAVFRADTRKPRACRNKPPRFRPQVQWLTTNYKKKKDKSFFAMPGQSELTCSPTTHQWVDALTSFLANRAEGIKKVYISTTQSNVIPLKEFLVDLQAKGIEFVITTPRKEDPIDQAIDHIVLSRAKYLIADGYSDLSQVVTEGWLMAHRFDAERLYLI